MISDEEYSNLLAQYDFSHKENSIVKGKILNYEKDCITVDIKGKTNAVCPFKEILYSDEKELKELFKIGEEYDFIIMYKDLHEDAYYLSHKKIAIIENSKALIEKYKNNETVKGKITNITKGGILVNVMGIKGFVPQSQIRLAQYSINDEIELKILSFDDDKTNFIFSNKKVYLDSLEEVKKEIFDKIELNMVVKGKVSRLVDFGAFIDIGGTEGLLPLSQISYKWIDKPEDVLEAGQEINVEIIGIDKEKQRISLSLKSLEENPWIKAQEFIKDKATVSGRVTTIKPFGVFIEIYPDVEGLINSKDIQKYYEKNQKELKTNDKVEVEIKKFDIENQKIILEIV